MKRTILPVICVQDNLYFRASEALATSQGERIALLHGYSSSDGAVALDSLDRQADRVLPLLDGIASCGPATTALYDERGRESVVLHGQDESDARFRAQLLEARARDVRVPLFLHTPSAT